MEAPKLAPAPSGWTYQFTPYGWVPWITGDAVIKGRSFTVSETPIEVLEQVNMVWMSYQQAKNGPLTLFTDVMYASVANSDSFLISKTFSPHVSGTIGAVLSADYQYWIVEGGATYEVASWNSHGAPYASPDTELELLAGGRYWRQELDVALTLDGTVNFDGLIVSGNRALATSGGVEWVDPFVGARIRFQPAPGEEVILRGDIGGFGAGSKFTWQALATYSWQMWSLGPMLIDGYAGWRALQVDYVQGAGVDRYEFDVLQQGPVLGVTGRF